jgi:phospholipid/cholesterol/gamma-HCH transport system substrate-binding protein
MSPSAQTERQTALRVGIFMLLGIAVLTFAVIMLGSKGGLFSAKSDLYVYFGDINGLVVGAPVRLAGLDVGRVSKIEFADDLRKREARVELSIQDRFLPRVRRDSRAFIDSKGLLGDKLVNITIGSVSEPPLKDGDTIATRTGLSIEELAGKMEQAVTSITHVTDQAGAVLEGIATPQAREDLQRILHSTAALIEGVEKQDGVLHRLVYDDKYADQVGAILQETSRSMSALRGAVEHVQAIAGEVKGGQGTLHELIYGTRGTEALGDLRAASAELTALVQSVRKEPGLLHSLIYDEQSGDMLKQWSEFSERVNRLSQSVEQGRGTVGGLLVDPSVYEDMKTVLGNIERNVLFKALIRYTIKQDDLQRPALMPQKASSAAGASR